MAEYETWSPAGIYGLNTGTDRSSYLSAWSEYGPGNKLVIMAARISLDGGVRDLEGIRVFEGTHTKGPQLNVVASKGNYVVLWTNQNAIWGVRVDRDGGVLDAVPFSAMTAPTPGTVYSFFPAPLPDGGLVMAWAESVPTGERSWVHWMDGLPRTTNTTDVGLGLGGIGETAAGDTSVLVPVNNYGTARAHLISTGGTLQSTTGTTGTSVEGSSTGWNGSYFMVAWRGANTAEVRATRIAPNGTVLDAPAFVVHTPTNYVTHIHGAGIGDRHVVQWQEPGGVFSARFDAGSTTSTISPVFQGAVLHTNHAPATHPEGALTAYVANERGGRVWSTRYDADGLPIPGSQARVMHIINPQRAASAAISLGTTWLAWLEDVGPGATGNVRASRLTGSSTLPVASPDRLALAQLGVVHPRILSLEPHALALWADGAQLKYATTDGTDAGWSASTTVGNALATDRQPAGAVSATSYAIAYATAAQQWALRTIDPAGTASAPVTIAATGVSAHPALLAVDGGFAFFEGNAVFRVHGDGGVDRIDAGLPAISGDALLGVSRSESDLLLARARLGLPAAGVELFVVDPTDLRVAGTLATVGVDAGITGLDVVFDGFRHAILWSSGSRVFGLRVHGGAVVGTPISLGDGVHPRFVRALPTEWTFAVGSPHGPRRLDRLVVKQVTFDPPGTACATSETCGSGFCVDGVCCNSACGGGAADCQSCAGATVGVCAPLASGTVCRPASGLCNPAESCDGVALTCPADIPNTCDAGVPDAGVPDAGTPDAGTPDAGTPDAGVPDAGTPDAGVPDAGVPDAGVPDAGTPDAGRPDAGSTDAGLPPVTGLDGGIGPADPTGCGCTSGGDPTALALAMLAFTAVRARKRRS